MYDNAITQDLSSCIATESGASPVVKIMGEDGMMGVLAQIEEDKIHFPALFLNRHPDTPLDSSRFNFSRLHKGIAAGYDPEKNNIYLEKSAPIDLKYDLHVLTTNTVDMDEIIRELLFRYSSMYYLIAEVPYESKRKIRFGVAIDPDNQIQRKRGNFEYIESGTLYESIIELKCQGAVLINYTPRHIVGVKLDDVIHVKDAGQITKDSNL